jgi:hypothetical protein
MGGIWLWGELVLCIIWGAGPGGAPRRGGSGGLVQSAAISRPPQNDQRPQSQTLTLASRKLFSRKRRNHSMRPAWSSALAWAAHCAAPGAAEAARRHAQRRWRRRGHLAGRIPAGSRGVGVWQAACLPACLPARLTACLPACPPACLPARLPAYRSRIAFGSLSRPFPRPPLPGHLPNMRRVAYGHASSRCDGHKSRAPGASRGTQARR